MVSTHFVVFFAPFFAFLPILALISFQKGVVPQLSCESNIDNIVTLITNSSSYCLRENSDYFAFFDSFCSFLPHFFGFRRIQHPFRFQNDLCQYNPIKSIKIPSFIPFQIVPAVFFSEIGDKFTSFDSFCSFLLSSFGSGAFLVGISLLERFIPIYSFNTNQNIFHCSISNSSSYLLFGYLRQFRYVRLVLQYFPSIDRFQYFFGA